MELTKLQIIALCVLTTVVTNKFLYNNSSSKNNPSSNQVEKPTITLAPVQNSSPSASVAATTSSNSQNELILRELVNLRKDMFSAIGNLPTPVSSSGSAVPTMSQSLLGGMVKISSPQWKRVNVYEKASTSSKIINSLVYDTIYFYRQKTNGWYQMDLDSGQIGWVQADFLKEFP